MIRGRAGAVSVVVDAVHSAPVVRVPGVWPATGRAAAAAAAVGPGRPVTRFRAVAARGRRRRGRRRLFLNARARRPSSVFFLVLDPPVLEPDLHLFLGQPQTVGDLDAPQPRQIHVVGELPLQFQQLVAGERRPDPLRAPGIRVALAVVPQGVRYRAGHPIWKQKKKKKRSSICLSVHNPYLSAQS